jgi:O-antigen/teichoic acid export membrane protein
MSEKTEGKGLWYHSLIYWLGIVLSKLASFLLIPIFTHYLAPADYGTLELLTTTTGVLALLIAGRLTTAVFRFYHIAESETDKRRVMSTALLLGLSLAMFFGVILFWTAPYVSRLVLGSAEHTYLFRIIFASTLLGIVQDLALTYLRIHERSILFVAINLARVLLMLTLNVVFIAVFGLGILGALLGPIIVASLFMPALVAHVLWQTGLGFDRRLTGRIVRFSAPLVPSALAIFVVHFSDRYIMREFGTLEQVGIYAVAYKFGMLVSALIGQPFGLIWGNRLHTYYWDPNRDALYNKTLSGLSFVLCVAATGLSLFIDEVLMVMTPSAYWSAAPLVPVIAAGYVLFVLNSISCAPLHCEAKTTKLAAITISVAVFSVALNLVLIPLYGPMGAAITTVIAFATMLSWTRLASMRYSTLRLEHDRAWKPMVAAVLVVLVGRGLSFDDLWTGVAVKMGLLLAYPAVLLALGFLRPSEWQTLRAYAHALFMRTKRA